MSIYTHKRQLKIKSTQPFKKVPLLQANSMYPIYPHYVQPSQSLQTQEQFQFTIKKTTIFHHTNNNYDNQVSLP